jgi:hypothetical protein
LPIASLLSPSKSWEALAGAHNGGQRLLRRDGAVDQFRAVAAEIAIAAGLGHLAEIGEQRLSPAARRFAKRDQRVEALLLDALLLSVASLSLICRRRSRMSPMP